MMFAARLQRLKSFVALLPVEEVPITPISGTGGLWPICGCGNHGAKIVNFRVRETYKLIFEDDKNNYDKAVNFCRSDAVWHTLSYSVSVLCWHQERLGGVDCRASILHSST